MPARCHFAEIATRQCFSKGVFAQPRSGADLGYDASRKDFEVDDVKGWRQEPL